MPEGDTVYRTAVNLHAALAGHAVVRSDVRVPKFATADLSGEVITEVASRGKHLLMRVGSSTIHSHLKMEGSWHLYRPGSRWRRPAHEARIVLSTADWTAVGFSLGVLEILPTAEEESVVGHLGPDLLGPDWNADEVVRRIRALPDRAIGLALLDQRNLAGIGNVYRAELCFLRGVLPTRPVREVPDLPGMVALAHRVLQANKNRVERTTTGDLHKGKMDWVYGRAGQRCLRCGAVVERATLGDPLHSDQALQDRDTYWCPHCQR